MRIIEPRQLRTVKYRGMPKKRRWPVLPWVFLVILLAGVTAGTLRYNRPIAPPQSTITKQTYSKREALFTWPDKEQAAVGAVGYGLLSQSPNQKQAPTASVAKVITALAVLEQKPLALNEPGESILVTEQDVAIYNKYVAIEGSVIPVQVGGSLTQYQALQALLLPSANNAAELLTNWAFGSQENYVTYANNYVAKLKLSNTRVADSSGFSPQTVSTAGELVQLGVRAMANPVIAQIVQQSEATIPMAGTIRSTNLLLGQAGVNGIKTGNTNEAGGCYLVSSTQTYEGGKSVTIVTAIMGAPTVVDAMNASKPLTTKTKQGFGDTIVVTAGQQFARLTSAWDTQTAVVAQKDVTLFGWQYGTPTVTTKLQSANFTDGAVLGQAQISFGPEKATVALEQDGDLGAPSLWWRLRRIVINE